MVLQKKQIFFIFSPINTDYYIQRVKNLLYAKIYKITYHLPLLLKNVNTIKTRKKERMYPHRRIPSILFIISIVYFKISPSAVTFTTTSAPPALSSSTS